MLRIIRSTCLPSTPTNTFQSITVYELKKGGFRLPSAVLIQESEHLTKTSSNLERRRRQNTEKLRVSVQGVKSLGGHFACLCRGFEFYEVKKKIVIIFQKENGNTFTLFIISIVKSLQKEQKSTNLLL